MSSKTFDEPNKVQVSQQQRIQDTYDWLKYERKESSYGEAASLDEQMVEAATEAILAHLEQEGDLRSRAVEQGLIAS